MADAPTPQALEAQANREVAQDISSQTGPLEGKIGSERGGLDQALGQLGKMYGTLIPGVQQAAQFVQQSYDKGLAQEKGIFDTAVGRLNQIRAQRAAEAQAMAQSIGGPVNVESFLAPLNTSMVELPNAAANTMFHSNALALGGVQEAQAFAQRVFPLMQVEQAAQLRNTYQDRINQYQDEIDRINATKSGAVKTRLDELLQQERTYKLQQATLALDRLKAERDWKLSQAELAQNRTKLQNEKANLLGYYDKQWKDKQGKMHTSRIWTLGGRTQTDTVAAQKAQLAEDARAHDQVHAVQVAQVKQTAAARKASIDQNNKAFRQTQLENASKYVDALMHPGTEMVKTNKYTEIPADVLAGMTAAQKAKLYHAAPGNEKTGFYRLDAVSVPIKGPLVENPTEIYKYLVAHAIPPAVARDSVIKRFGFDKDWKPGTKYDPSKQPLSKDNIMSGTFNQLRTLARQRGWQPNPNKPATVNTLRRWLYDFYNYGTPATDYKPPPKGDVSATIEGSDFNELRAMAVSAGWVPDPNHPATKQTLKDWLYQKAGGKAKNPGATEVAKAGPPAPAKKVPGTKRTIPAKSKWNPNGKFWYDPDSNAVLLRGHPPNKQGQPT